MHVRKTPSGSWQATVKHLGRRRAVNRPTRREAVAAARRLEDQMRGESGAVWDRPTVGSAVAERIRTATWSPTLTAEYHRAGDRLPVRLAGTPLDQVTVPIVEHAYATLTAGGMSPHPIRRLHELLRSTFAEAVRVGAVDRSPMTAVRPPPKPARDIHPPTPGQVRRLLAACDGAALLAFTLASTTGVRRGELAGLRWTDVDFDTGRVSIHRSHAYAPGAGVHERPTKTGRKGQRTVSLDADTLSLLRAWRTEQIEAALAHQMGRPIWVFSDDSGATPWRPDRFTHEFGDARTRANLSGFRLHDLRHYVATRLLSAGVPVDRVAALLGHASPATTADTYRHWIPGEDADLVDMMANITRSG